MTLKHKGSVIISLVILVSFSFLTRLQVKEQSDEFTATKPNMAIVNNDDSAISNGLLEYLNDKVELTDVDSDGFEDAMFYRMIFFAVEIPEGYGLDFAENGTELNALISVDSSQGYLAQNYVEEYLSYVKAYMNEGYSQEVAVKKVLDIEVTGAEVVYHQGNAQISNLFLSYKPASVYAVLLCLLTILVPTLAMFKREKVKRRVEVGAISATKRNLNLLVATVVCGHIVWIITEAIAISLFFNDINWSLYGYTLLNSYVLLWVGISLAFLISEFAKSPSIQTGIITVVTLGTSFISGVFVPQSVLNDVIINISKLFPIYWNIQSNQAIMNGGEILSNMMQPVLIQCLFVVVFTGFGILFARNKSSKA